MKVVGVVGMPASGKTEAAEVAREEDVPVVSMGDVIREEVELRGLEPTDENMGRVAVALREKEGDDAVARRCAAEIRSKDAPVVLVDGVRSADEVDYFREEFGDVRQTESDEPSGSETYEDDFVLVAVEAPFETRLERVRSRGRSDDFDAADELRERDERELGYGMGEAIEEADVTIENDGSLEEFREEFRAVLTEESQ